jgi:hypothetical protein
VKVSLIFFILSLTIQVVSAHEAVKLKRYLEAVSAEFTPEVRSALLLMNGDERRLLALRGYLRAGKSLQSRWAWTEQRIKQFKTTPEYARMMEEVAKVQRRFAELNPGYTLFVNSDVRSLEFQVASWNKEPSIAEASAALYQDALREMQQRRYRDVPTYNCLTSFRNFLRSYVLRRPATVATPGLSHHGQLKAFDFVVKRGDQIIAGTTTATLEEEWERPGWSQKLNRAIRESSTKFAGPLQIPREPWHYSYIP